MSQTFDCTSEATRAAGIEAAVAAVRDHDVVVLPTDTVYGVGADAFSPEAVRAVLDAKGRGADMPPPVLIPHARTVDGLATQIPGYARDLMEAFWPGPLTLVLLAQPSLMWDLGDTNGTVALRVPQDEVALELLAAVGPMAVTSANLTGRPAALTVREARLMLGDAVSVYLDGGPSRGEEASTILDCTQEQPRVLRPGAIAVEELEKHLGDVRIEGREHVHEALAAEEAARTAGAQDVEPTDGGEPLAVAADVAEDVAEDVAGEGADDGEQPSVAATQDAEGGRPAGRHRAVSGAVDPAGPVEDDGRDAPGLAVDPHL